jgi:carbonic anhydrase
MVLSTVAEIEKLGTGFEILIMHHTDCGLARLASGPYTPLVAEFAGVTVEEVAALAVADPWQSARFDGQLMAALAVSPDTAVTAAVYDLNTGRVESVYSSKIRPELRVPS